MSAGDPLWLDSYIAGLQAGYAARCREEAAAWQEESAVRVWVAGEWINRPTAAARKAERMVIIREAHVAGLHDHRPHGCPWCNGKNEGDS